ncbi:MAG: glutamate racemase [Clostridia bacterium]
MLNYKNPTIAVLDSGIGGISVLHALIDRFKVGNYIYYADNEFMPYGNKSRKQIRSRVENIINILFNQYHVDIVVLACNTASSSMINSNDNVVKMRFNPNIPYLATRLTRSNLKSNNIIVDNTLARQIEKYIFDRKKLHTIIKKKSKVHKLDQIPSLVLGCTHYELVKDIFETVCPNTTIINNSDFILGCFDHMTFDNTDLNINVILSKYSNSYYQKLIKLINI